MLLFYAAKIFFFFTLRKFFLIFMGLRGVWIFLHHLNREHMDFFFYKLLLVSTQVMILFIVKRSTCQEINKSVTLDSKTERRVSTCYCHLDFDLSLSRDRRILISKIETHHTDLSSLNQILYICIHSLHGTMSAQRV